MKLKECTKCGFDFWSGKLNVTECMDCRSSSPSKYTKQEPIQIICPVCHRVFLGSGIRKYCSKDCSRRIRKLNIGLMTIDLKEYLCEKYFFTCQECNTIHNITDLHIHHVIPLSRGGENSEGNLTVLCIYCHRLSHGMRL